MSDTQQSLSKIRENYEKIRNNMETNDLNDIISDSSDELFAGLKEIVFSKKNTINIQNDIRRIARSLEDKHKKLEKDDNKYTQEIADINKDISKKTTEKTTKEGEIATNKTEITKIEGEIRTKTTEKNNKESEGKTKESEKRTKENSIKSKQTELRRKDSEIRSKEWEKTRIEWDIKEKKRDIEWIKKEIKNKKDEKSKTSDIKEKEKIDTEIKQLDDKRDAIDTEIKTLEDSRSTLITDIGTLKGDKWSITTDITYLEDEKNAIQTEIGDLKSDKDSVWSEVRSLESEKTTLNNKNESIGREIRGIEGEIQTLNNKLKDIQEKQQANKDNMNSIDKVSQTHKEIAKLADLFDTDKDLIEQKIKPNTSSTASIIGSFLRDINQKPSPLEFELYDGEDKKVTGDKIKNIKLKNGTAVNIEWIKINNNGEIVWDKAKVIDIASNKEIEDFPIEFELEIGAKTVFTGSLQQNTPNRDIAITNKKILKIKIDVDYLGQDKRKDEVNAYNNSWKGGVIEQSLTANHDVLIARLEREAFYRGLEKADGPKFNKLTADQKETLYQDVRKLYRTAAGRPRAGAQFGRAKNLAKMNNFGDGELSFLERITGDKHESNKPEFTKNGVAYRHYINNNLEDQIKKYFERRFDEVFSKNQDGNTYLKAELTNYLTEIERQKIDTDVHQDILWDIDDVDRMENRRRHAIDIWGRTYSIGRKDVNYLRFFAGKDSSVDVKDQTVNVTTNNRPEDLNNPEPVKYDMNMEVSGKQQILVNVKIDKQKEIKLKAWDPAAMVKRILQCEDIQHGKVRAHVVYNVIKGFIQASKKKDISLTYRDPETGNMMVIKMDGDNIVLEQQDNQTNYWGTHRRNTTALFDYKYFENTNTFDSKRGDENRRLRIGIDRLMGHFNFAMNELHYQYRQATERRRLGLRRWATRMTLPTSIFLSPIKKLFNFRTTTKFDFSTTVQSNGKSVSVEFIRNKFTLNMEWLKKPVSSRTLGRLLRHREWWVRIFDGMERDICGKINEEMVKKMRENTKVARTNFWVRDYITGRTYILDSDGQLGYLSAEQASEEQNMIRRGRLSQRQYGIVNNPPAGRTMCDESETREVMKNPFLMGRLIKTMNNRMGIISSTRALLN